ncbi:MAG: hypothetical protein HKN54_09190 [Flavobacteriaceae bacterium]|nr:hypothetical protein [Flavobacteriaceae bacterium]
MKRNTQSLQLRIFIIASLFIFAYSSAQVGVNKTNPDATLDIAASSQATPANNDGLLIPRIDAFPAANPGAAQDGMLVFHTTLGFHYWDDGTTSWLPFGGGGGPDWAFAGNATTGTEILGTTNGDDLRIYAGGSERILIQSNGQVLVNLAAPYFAGDQFTAEGTFAINGYTVDGIGTYGRATGVGDGVLGLADSFFGVNGQSNTGSGVIGQATAWNGVSGVGPNLGVLGDDAGANTVGVQGQTDSGIGTIGLAVTTGDGTWGLSGSGEGVYGNTLTGVGVWGETNSLIGVYGVGLTSGDGAWGIATSSGDGVYGDSDSGNGVIGFSTSADGVQGGGFSNAAYGGNFFNTGALGHGLIAAGNNIGGTVIPATGAGMTGTGLSFGSMGFANDAAGGTGLVGVGNNVTPFLTLVTGSGVSGSGLETGVAGFATTAANQTSFGGYFDNNRASFAYVGGSVWTPGPPGPGTFTDYKIIGSGMNSTIVNNTEGKPVTMVSPEAPEVLFQDYGIGKLNNGYAKIDLDPNLTKNIRVDDEHPIKVFVQLEGDCNGVYVTNKSASGFEVKELQGGNSNVSFSWSITATRADQEIILNDGSTRLSNYGWRFNPAPEELSKHIHETKPVSNTVQKRNRANSLSAEEANKKRTADARKVEKIATENAADEAKSKRIKKEDN